MSNNNYKLVESKLRSNRAPESKTYKKQLERHLMSIDYPNMQEKCILDMLYSLAIYADEYQKKWKASISEDSVIGEYWFNMLRILNNLLSGDTGRLDCGTMHHTIQELVKNVGFEELEA